MPLLLDPPFAPRRDERAGLDPGGCVALWEEVRGQADALASALYDMQRLAARESVLPGHVREARAEHRLEGWERYPVR